MEENNNSKNHQESSFEKFWDTNKRLIYIVIAAIIFLLLLVFGNDFFGSSKIFTQYEDISIDSTSILLDSVEAELDAHSMNEGVKRTPTEAKPEKLRDSTSPSIFSVHTKYDKIMPRESSDNKSATAQEGLFEKLLLPNEQDQEFETFFDSYRNDNVLSSQSILKILAITGRSILLEHNDADDRLLMQVLTEAERVNGILIVNIEGKIVYATNQKYLDTAITSIMPEIDLSEIRLSWYQKDNDNIVSIPVFHTFGKIGTAVLITQI